MSLACPPMAVLDDTLLWHGRRGVGCACDWKSTGHAVPMSQCDIQTEAFTDASISAPFFLDTEAWHLDFGVGPL